MRALVLALLMTATAQADVTPTEAGTAATAARADQGRVDRILAGMSLQDKAAQLLMTYPQLDRSGPVPYGGVVYVGALLKDLDKAKERIASARQRAEIPPFFSVDMEGGSFHRMPTHPALTELPSAEDMAKLSDEEVRAWGQRVGEAMVSVGLDMNLAPVLDVAPSGHMRNNHRSFSGDPAVVAAKAAAFSQGLWKAGVVPVGKHFPGYGDLSADTDHHLVTAGWSEDKLQGHIAVFEQAAPSLGAVMMSNVIYSAVSESPAILDGGLVGKAHALGLPTVTDDLAIGALAENAGGDPAEVVRRAFLAGNDLLLTTAPPDWDKGVDYVGVLVELVEGDPALEKQLEESCRRVLGLKDRLGMLEGL